MDTAKNQLTPTLKGQVLQVRDTAEADMLDCNAVMAIAAREGWYELADYLMDKKNWKTYGNFIVTGGETDTEKYKNEGPEDMCYEISQVKFQDNNYVSGKIGDLHFWAKVYTEGSKFGIDDGNVSKLTVWPEYGSIIINYDRGWKIRPQDAGEKKIVTTILNFCNHIYDGIKDFMHPSVDWKEKR